MTDIVNQIIGHGVTKTCMVDCYATGVIQKIKKNGGDLLTRTILPYGS